MVTKVTMEKSKQRLDERMEEVKEYLKQGITDINKIKLYRRKIETRFQQFVKDLETYSKENDTAEENQHYYELKDEGEEVIMDLDYHIEKKQEEIEEKQKEIEREEKQKEIEQEEKQRERDREEREKELIRKQEMEKERLHYELEMKKMEIESKKLEKAENRQSTAKNASIRLPKIELKGFDGNLLKWQEFWDTFNATIHSNKNLHNTHVPCICNASFVVAVLNMTPK